MATFWLIHGFRVRRAAKRRMKTLCRERWSTNVLVLETNVTPYDHVCTSLIYPSISYCVPLPYWSSIGKRRVRARKVKGTRTMHPLDKTELWPSLCRTIIETELIECSGRSSDRREFTDFEKIRSILERSSSSAAIVSENSPLCARERNYGSLEHKSKIMEHVARELLLPCPPA